MQNGVTDVQNPKYGRCHKMPGFSLYLPVIIIQMWVCLGVGIGNAASNSLFVRWKNSEIWPCNENVTIWGYFRSLIRAKLAQELRVEYWRIYLFASFVRKLTLLLHFPPKETNYVSGM